MEGGGVELPKGGRASEGLGGRRVERGQRALTVAPGAGLEEGETCGLQKIHWDGKWGKSYKYVVIFSEPPL